MADKTTILDSAQPLPEGGFSVLTSKVPQVYSGDFVVQFGDKWEISSIHSEVTPLTIISLKPNPKGTVPQRGEAWFEWAPGLESELKHKWDRKTSFGWGVSCHFAEKEQMRVANAVISYMTRCLSRRRVPNPEWLASALLGDTPIPSCGCIGCFWDEPHVH